MRDVSIIPPPRPRGRQASANNTALFAHTVIAAWWHAQSRGAPPLSVLRRPSYQRQIAAPLLRATHSALVDREAFAGLCDGDAHTKLPLPLSAGPSAHDIGPFLWFISLSAGEGKF